MKVWLRTAILAACMMLVFVSGVGRADEVPIITGEHWTKSSEEMKKAYLVGVANVLQIEIAYEGANPPADAQSIAPRFAKGLKGQTLDSVRQALNDWYAAHPDRLQRPVIETIWFELVVPGLRQNG
ncbi:MAG TPA: hypothetical protein VL742_17425 [Casimicrobiaceae bacterium]|nr:hypothetical protein [Casimicrobiaceae bacterium]